jgi:hypothetical protein
MGSNWKLKLKYGKTKTKFSHFTIIADGIVGELSHGFNSRKGPAHMGIKIWALDSEQAVQVAVQTGEQIGFKCNPNKIYVYDSDPKEPPGDVPSAYGINFHSYKTPAK